MCCQTDEELGLPPAVIEALARYRRLRDERGWDWGGEQLPDFFRWARFSALGDVFEAFAETGGWPAAIRSVVGGTPPAGVVVVRAGEDGRLDATTGPARPVIAGRPVPIDVVVEARRAVMLDIAGERVELEADGVAIRTVDVDRPVLVVTDGERELRIEDAVRVVPAARLRLSSPRCARWSVTDADGGAWFPDGVLRKWDVHHRPFFHADDVTLDVPAGTVRVACARGLEFERVEQTLTITDRHELELDPPRLFDPAADGWYGGDLHIHLNYSGDLVCTPQDAARMQRGEGLHLANLVAATLQTATVYDRELLDAFPGTDLPTSTPDAVARAGVEFRNDLLGHVHARGPGGRPSRFHTGHEHSDHPYDWPPNSEACRELRELGATVGYAHPSFTPFPDDWTTDRFFENPRSVEARELVADAALGLVDSIDLVSPFDDEGAVFLYHRLLSCGLRLTATAGTDVFLSFSHGPGVASNPPGWGRVYADLRGSPLSVDAFKQAVRAGRTIVTNGPWLTLDVDGHGPGAVLDARPGDRLPVRASVIGPGVETLTIAGPDGVVAEGDPATGVRTVVDVDGPTWLAAIARGPGHPNVLDAAAFAHTSPVYVEVRGDRVARAADARWCLAFLETLRAFAAEHGRWEPADRAAHLGDLEAVLDAAGDYYRGVLGRAAAGG